MLFLKEVGWEETLTIRSWLLARVMQLSTSVRSKLLVRDHMLSGDVSVAPFKRRRRLCLRHLFRGKLQQFLDEVSNDGGRLPLRRKKE
jgi:hypothetical protein